MELLHEGEDPGPSRPFSIRFTKWLSDDDLSEFASYYHLILEERDPQLPAQATFRSRHGWMAVEDTIELLRRDPLVFMAWTRNRPSVPRAA